VTSADPSADPKLSRRAGRDPEAEKAKDDARQRKIASNGSDKAARRHAPRIKAEANRVARRKARVPVDAAAEGGFDDGAQAAADLHRAKDRHWGSANAAERRAQRAEEGQVLDATADRADLPRGRRRVDEARRKP
jgi:hypothetical protein